MSAIPERKLAAIMLADIAGFSALMERNESGTFDRLRALREQVIAPKVLEHGGRVIKTTGDGFLADFTSATAALQCGIAIQRQNIAREQPQPDGERIHMRIGINVGDVIIDGDDVAGDGVVIAARLEPLAPLDGICVSSTVREHVRQELGIEYQDLGNQQVKNISRPIRAYRIDLAGTAGVNVSPAPAQRRKRRVPLRALAGVAALLAISVASIVGYRAFVATRTAAADVATDPDTRMTFAILPPTAPEGDKAAAAFASSVMDALITRQTNSPWSRVVSRESVEAALKSGVPADSLGRTLRVRYLIRGNIVSSKDSFLTTLAIVDAASGQVMGSRDFSWPASRPVNVYRPEIDSTIGALAGKGYRRELEQVKLKKDSDFDARDMAYLANDVWDHTREGYDKAMSLLRRSLAKAPDDRLSLMLLARINLCECRGNWSKNPKEQEKIGSDAVDKYLARAPADRPMLLWKAYLHDVNGRFDDALVLLDRLLEKSPGDPELLANKAYDLHKLGQSREALALVQEVMREDPSTGNRAFAAAMHFRLGNNDEAARWSQMAIAEMDARSLADRWTSQVLLVRAAANANLGRKPQAKAALEAFDAAAPNRRSISAIKEWLDYRAELAGYEPLYEGLRKAGVPD